VGHKGHSYGPLDQPNIPCSRWHRAGKKCQRKSRKHGHSSEEQPLVKHHARGQPAATGIPTDRAPLHLGSCYGISPLPLSSTPCLPTSPSRHHHRSPPLLSTTCRRARRRQMRPHPWPLNRRRCQKIERERIGLRSSI
jgi:hypothetical protein